MAPTIIDGDKKVKKNRRAKRHKKSEDPSPASDVHHPSFNNSEQPLQSQVFFGRVPEDLSTYFHGIERMLSAEALADKNDEERSLFIQNIFNEVDGKELMLATDSLCSRIMEKLICLSDSFAIRVLMDRFAGHYAGLCTHRFGSHVMETLLSSAVNVIYDEVSQGISSDLVVEEGTLLSMQSLFLSLCAELGSNWSIIICDTYGSHIVRMLITILSGGNGQQKPSRSSSSTAYAEKHQMDSLRKLPHHLSSFQPPSKFSETLDQMVGQLCQQSSDLEFRSYINHVYASPVIHSILTVLSGTSATSEYIINRILMSDAKDEDDFVQQHIDTMMSSTLGSRLLETLLPQMSDKILADVFDKWFKNRLLHWCQDPVANYLIQKLIEIVQNVGVFEKIVDELSPKMGSLIFRGRSNVVVRILQSSSRLSSSSSRLCEDLLKAFELDTPDRRKDAINLVLHLQNWTAYSSTPSKSLEPAGSRILQELFKFPTECISFLVGSMLSLCETKPTDLLRDPISSRVFEAFLESPSIETRLKYKMLSNLNGSYYEMAIDKYGSHIVDKAWQIMDVERKIKVAEELSVNYKDMTPKPFGRIIVRNLKLEAFRRNREQWIAKEKSIQHKAKTIKKFLPELEAAAIKKDAPQIVVKSEALIPSPDTNEKKDGKKSKRRNNDDIDDLFKSVDVKHKKKKK